MFDRIDPVLAGLLAEQPALATFDIDTMRLHARVSKQRWNAAPRPWLDHAPDAGLESTTGRPVWTYRDRTRAVEPPVLWLHGGGWVIGSLSTHHGMLADMARASGRRVYALHPRQAPEAPYPLPLDDVVACLAALGRRYPAGFHLAGDSAGANLALGALARAQAKGFRPPLRSLTLVYGCFDAGLTADSHRQFGDGRFGFSTAKMRAFWAAYGGGGQPDADLLQAPLPECPPVAFHAAQLDPLRDETIAMAQRLAAPVTLWPGMTHGFLHYAPDLAQAAHAFARIADFMRRNDP